jgi:hypothetical protein
VAKVSRLKRVVCAIGRPDLRRELRLRHDVAQIFRVIGDRPIDADSDVLPQLVVCVHRPDVDEPRSVGQLAACQPLRDNILARATEA